MINEKIARVLRVLNEQSLYEIKHEDELPHNQRMLAISNECGMLYNIILRGIKAKRILEIGTSTGYSTLWFGDALLTNMLENNMKSTIITIENDLSKVQKALKNFSDAGIKNLIDVRVGDALEILSDMSKSFDKYDVDSYFDFVFLDADKDQYIDYFDMCLPMVKVGGIIATDNILSPKRFNDSMKKYVEHVRSNSTVQSVTVPIDDGEEITIKTS